MKRFAVLPLCLTLVAGPVLAGSAAEPAMEPEVIMADAASSSSDNALAVSVMLLAVALIAFTD
ncbi:hypothetical protein [Thalassovita aquimarina]|uniref:Ferrochelatase n=1 Tax=Thalassovita aquimarina TaxID=2785917 RepID=A0ABS5HMY7_9RHOB|nr:hypothetical protein [Thalassovita aquimarina]MBR9650288.1 hypothetical protein [Thalassovita aquimarina]